MSLISKTLTVAAMLTSTAAVAGTLVVKSSGPSARTYPPGKSIPDNARVALKAGDVVTVLDKRGTRVLRGPGSFSTSAATSTGSSFDALLRNTGARQVRTGAVRTLGVENDARAPNVWLVDATRGGTICLISGQPLSLWAPAREGGSSLTVTRLGDGKSAAVAMRPGQSVKLWPADLAATAGDQFRVTGAATVPVSVRFATLAAGPDGLEATAAALLQAGCSTQLDALIAGAADMGADSGGRG